MHVKRRQIRQNLLNDVLNEWMNELDIANVLNSMEKSPRAANASPKQCQQLMGNVGASVPAPGRSTTGLVHGLCGVKGFTSENGNAAEFTHIFEEVTPFTLDKPFDACRRYSFVQESRTLPGSKLPRPSRVDGFTRSTFVGSATALLALTILIILPVIILSF